MKILIVGAGIGGLSTYIALHKHLLPLVPSLSIRLVESHAFLSGPKASPLASASTIVGAGLGLAPNGLRAIHALSPKAAQYITDRAFVDGAEKFVLRSSSGSTLGVFAGGSKERYGGFGMAMVPRGVVFEALMQAFQELGREGASIEWGRKVVSIKELGAEGVEVEDADGTKEVVDLVIGADGVRSRVRDSLFEGKYPAEYE
jgi:2-polyprenyl-6-methoxyphenol hydroxylase-like FAD-dependent oxidoreductase